MSTIEEKFTKHAMKQKTIAHNPFKKISESIPRNDRDNRIGR